jgi:hypothetical protein
MGAKSTLNAIQKLRVMDLVGGPGATTPTTWRRRTRVSCHSHWDFDRPDGARPLAQATVPRDDPASDLRIVRYLAGTGFAQSLVPRQAVVVATLAETAFTEYTPKLLVYPWSIRDAFIRSIRDYLGASSCR